MTQQPCKHIGLKDIVYESMGDPFHSAKCPDCHQVIAIRWIPRWETGVPPSEKIRERAEERIRKMEQETGEPVRNYDVILGCQVEAIKEHLDALAGFPQDK